ncbi:hypothetical protein HN588_11680, partial [Candidatus Bathyarchaeota archaeon]|nr:hypothetical protein [Candidatus Bathyarchaeota archaeon]
RAAKQPDETAAEEEVEAPEVEAPEEEEERLAAGFNPQGMTISELRQYIRHSLETE